MGGRKFPFQPNGTGGGGVLFTQSEACPRRRRPGRVRSVRFKESIKAVEVQLSRKSNAADEVLSGLPRCPADRNVLQPICVHVSIYRWMDGWIGR